MTPEEFESFLTLWLMQANAGGLLNPWKHEIRVPADFGPHVRFLCMRGIGTTLREVEVMRCPQEWSGWMGFRGFPLVLHQSHQFQIYPRSDNTKRLIRGLPGQTLLPAPETSREPTAGEKRREEVKKTQYQNFIHKEAKKWAKRPVKI